MGPIGLLIEAVIWNGLVIDADMKIWQRKEEPIDLLRMPYQSLKPQLLMTAARARSLAEWNRNTSTPGPREIDRETSQVDPGLT